MGVQYAPEVPFWRTLFRCSGSVIPAVILSPIFMIELLIHLILLSLDRCSQSWRELEKLPLT